MHNLGDDKEHTNIRGHDRSEGFAYVTGCEELADCYDERFCFQRA